MSLQLKICRATRQTWSVHGLSPIPMSHLPSLPASIDYARTACEAAPATIELVVDGMYIVVHQERGWPRQIVAAESDLTLSARTEPDPKTVAKSTRPFAWLQQIWHSIVKGSFAEGASLRLG